jgi:peptidoglycan hydrolase CwlO-like protein
MDKWKTYLKNYKNVKVKTAKDEVVGDNVLIKEWGNNPVDIYARFEENKQEKTVRMMVAYNLGGAYLTSTLDANKYAAAEKMVRDFAVETTKAPLILKVKDAEKVLGKMEGDRDGIEKDIKNLRSDIENYRDKISKAEKDITKAEDELSKKKSEIDGQRINIQLLNNQAGEVK